ncbi:hypothetical protein QN277_013257 [Acacia crassicarpa]|uniref:Uncharacterized protein n=1 Tax=Acacia crassicarpa TaxID=499986 RepID=A0AAE1N1Y8_9FABA|nr:hypothetical protein QN277_013257 [Acacia crassicarpa]
MHRFPNLNHVDLISGSLISPCNSSIFLSHRVVSLHTVSGFSAIWCIVVSDIGLTILAQGCKSFCLVGVKATLRPRQSILLHLSS